MRAVLYQISNQEHILLVNLHHIISDGWSLGIFVQELTKFYSAFVEWELLHWTDALFITKRSSLIYGQPCGVCLRCM